MINKHIVNIKNSISLFYRNRFFYNPIKAILRNYLLWKFRILFNLFPYTFIIENIKIKIHTKIVALGSGGCIFSSNGYYFPNNQFLLKELFGRLIYKNFIDCGANIGFYSIIVAKNSSANIICFEPHPTTFKYLTENIQLNELTQKIKPYNLALGNQNGFVNFTNEPGSAGNKVTDLTDINTIPVKAIRLDDFIIENNIDPEFIKIDVEGYENEVLVGLDKIINNVKFFMIEVQNLQKTCKIIVDRYGFLGPFQIDYKSRIFIKNSSIKEDWIFIRPDQIDYLRKFEFKFEY